MKPPPSSTILRGQSGKQAVSQPSVSIDQLLASLQRRGVPMPFEMGTFLVLEASERLIATMPVVVTSADVWLSDEGELMVVTQGSAAAPEREACRALIMLLGDLLVRSAPGVPPMLLQLVERGPSEGDWRLARLRDDLEASLVPLNRGATRRVLARLLREAKRDAERSVAPPPDPSAVDRELDEMLGLDSDPVPPQSTPARAAPLGGTAPALRGGASFARPPAPPEDTIDVDLEVDTTEVPRLEPQRAPGRERPRATPRRAAKEAPGASPREVSEPEAAPPPGSARRESLDDFEHAAAGRGSGGRIGLWLLTLALMLVAAYAVIGRDGVRKLLGLDAAQSAALAPAADKLPAQAQAQRHGELRVSSSPPRAQVLMLVGTGPVVVPQLPIGMAHEFVAMQAGMAPSRAVVPADAKWVPEGNEPRYELALQLGALGAHAREDDLGTTRLTQDVGQPSGKLGSVRVITSPPGASVYQLIGFTPDVSVQNMPIDQPVELVVFLPGHAPQHVHVGVADWKPSPTGLLAEPTVTLTPDRH